ncbi:MAG: TipAS antibiotic-recognition domain-containing protein, partial [Candidatus Margulisbacteria bacterium]|nr:TipAS antibiotic-recognition domain-containing protein [Candidatus Margulisiibacteriota bacterium]
MSEINIHREKYAEETKKKYGHTDAYKESQLKTKGYKAEDWAKINSESAKIHQKLADLMDKGPGHPLAQQAIKEWQQHISKYFYNCTDEIFAGLGNLYISDQRFAENIDKVKSGLAAFMKSAIDICCSGANLKKK